MDERGKILVTQAIASKFTGAKRLDDFKKQLIQVMNTYPVSQRTVFVEGYSYGSKNSREVLGELGGTIRLMLFEREIPFIVVPPTVLKKYATGKGNADKIAVGVAVMKGWGKEFPTSDQTDAFMLSEIGRAYLDLIPGLPVYKQEVIEGLKNPKVKKKSKSAVKVKQ
jgi:crossover junction endodeoxyribonuclease RuvC